MEVGDSVFGADSAHVGHLTAFDDEWLTVRDHNYGYKIPRSEFAYESEEGGRVFLKARNRSAVRLYREDVVRATGLRAWFERRVLGPSPRWVGGRLFD